MTRPRSDAPLLLLGLLPLLAACEQGGMGMGAAPPTAAAPAPAAAPVAEARIERDENLCPVIRFLVDGRPAEASGYDVMEAITAARQLFREKGLELVAVTRVIDRFQSKRIDLDTRLHQDDQSRRGSSAELDSSVRGSIRGALQETMRDLGEAELANCEWILTGQVDVGRPMPNPQSRFLDVNVNTWLTIVETFTDRGVGDAYTFGKARGPDPESAVRRGMAYSLESVVDTVAGQIRDARRLFVITIADPSGSGRKRSRVQTALRDAGFSVRSVVDGKSERQIDASFEQPIDRAEEAVNRALDQLMADPLLRGLDYQLRGRLLTITLAGG